jgi:hypothetical protein
MLTMDYVLAAALLTTPPDAELSVNANLFSAVGPAIQKLALTWEILDPREVRYVLARPEDFAADLKMLQRRYIDLAGAPPLHDSDRFPDRATVTEMLTFNRAYRKQMETRLAAEPVHWWEFQEMVNEADRLYQIWDSIRDARCGYYYVTVRRQALKKLQDALGLEAYYDGRLPPHVPLWRFQRIN